ncbi:DUF6792 domain-containing protein [Dyella sp. GSA-30]|uniref:DUF6792 domain-containing protein n=1 Tax=Dyella sp. GSA-30 TaxID=2994496 RepID=UPI002490183E|nr:DUF6792 domain-containing protein [Dyella sp. GSA-30]BDU23250.1 hypothetical protein DYGSA30_47070 [Dyella sp. GSA-30]
MGGIEYKVVDYYSNPVTGYQGTAYQRLDTNEVVIASRGTEPSGGTVQDALADLGMIVTGFNAQLPDARAFAKRVQENVDATAARKGIPLPTITATGHSLGGALTEALAYENHWHGETFNGFGAVDLQYNIPEGGAQVINHVRVTDVVGAANRHFGEVRYYATQEDIEALNTAGYTNATTGATAGAAHATRSTTTRPTTT